MRTIERNYRKNPHTASFLQTFHTGIGSNGRNYREELNVDEANARIREVMENGTAFQPAWMTNEARQDDADALAQEAAQDDDLLALVPEVDVIDNRTAGQVKFMEDLVARLAKLDREIGAQARTYTDGMTEHGKWTAGRGGNASAWIDRMLAKERELTAKVQAAPVAVADGRYAVEEDGVLRFFKVKNGNRPGFVFLDIQASDEWHSVRNVARIRSILALIAVDAEEASLRYGRELGICGDCGRTLTDETSRARGRGPVCDAKH